jgi:type II secretory pathway pseudopilin PulG
MMAFLYRYENKNRFRSHIARRQAGFTMVDILVGLAMASVVIVAIISLFTAVGRSYTIQNVAADVQQVTRAGIEHMAQNIRMAGLDPFGNAGAEIQEFNADKIRFSLDRCDIPIGSKGCGFPDGDVDDKFENVTYRWDPAERKLKQVLYEGTASAHTETLIENVSNLQFTYLDDDDGAAATAADIRTVIISLTVTDPAGRGGTVSRTYSARVRCRNLGL